MFTFVKPLYTTEEDKLPCYQPIHTPLQTDLIIKTNWSCMNFKVCSSHIFICAIFKSTPWNAVGTCRYLIVKEKQKKAAVAHETAKRSSLSDDLLQKIHLQAGCYSYRYFTLGIYLSFDLSTFFLSLSFFAANHLKLNHIFFFLSCKQTLLLLHKALRTVENRGEFLWPWLLFCSMQTLLRILWVSTFLWSFIFKHV